MSNKEYHLKDDRGEVFGIFKTKGLAHQYILEKYPWPERGDIRGDLMPRAMVIEKVITD